MENNQEKKKISTKNIILAAAAAAAVVAVILLITLVLVPRNAYLLAEDMVAAGQHGKAVAAFRELGDYSDSAQRAEALLEENPALIFALAKPGDIVTYGVYEQDGDDSNGAEPVEWVVLAQEEERVLAVSKDILDAKQYHLYEDKVLPKLASLTKWLNLDFTSMVFEDGLRSTVESAGLLEQDYLAALENAKVTANVTAFAKANGASGDNWWLNENQSYEDDLTAMTAGGEAAPLTEVLGVRPAIWVLTNNALLSENAAAVAEALEIRENAYEQAKKQMTIGEYESALVSFASLGAYADAYEQYLECQKIVAQQGASREDLLTAMTASIVDGYNLSPEVTDSSLEVKELQYICSTYYPYCGSFTFEVDGTAYTIESDFCYDNGERCVYWVCKLDEGGLFATEEAGETVSFFKDNTIVYGMTATAQIGAEEVTVLFEDGQLVAEWGEYQSVEVDEEGNVTSREDYQQQRIVTGTKIS